MRYEHFIDTPPAVDFILSEIRNRKYESYVVGGAVRDSLLGCKPKDWDIATNCDYETLKDIFKDYSPVEIGKAFGVIQVTVNEDKYEIAKYRVDGNYTDSRRPDEVEFTDSFMEDCRRRDLTINALGYYNGKVVDHFGGYEDLVDKYIQFIGNADARIKEDPLRMLRAIRFAYRHRFTMIFHTEFRIKINAELIKKIPK